MRENPNQAYHGALFGMSQGRASLWIKQLAPLLEEALHRMEKLPIRAGNQLYCFLCASIETVILMDITKRQVGRSTDYEVQKLHYSGKKGYHTLKNLLITTLEGEVMYLGETFEGSHHDKVIYDQAELAFPDQLHCLWATVAR